MHNQYIYVDKTVQRWAMEEDERKMIPHWSLSDCALLLQSVEWDGKDNEHSIIYFETLFLPEANYELDSVMHPTWHFI